MKKLTMLLILAVAFASAQTVNMGRTLVSSQNVRYANEGGTGTTVNKLAKLTGAPSTAIITATTDTSGIVGIVVAGAGTTSSSDIAVAGKASCVFDSATTAGHYVVNDTSTAGDCMDGGASYPTTGQVIGRVTSTNGGAGTYVVDLSFREAGAGRTTQYPVYRAAVCQNTTASIAVQTPTSNAPTAACVTGTNSQLAVLQFDDTTAESIQDNLALPADWSGTLDVTLYWRAAATTNDVVWAAQVACVAVGGSVDPAFNVATTATVAPAGTANLLVITPVNGLDTTGCAAGDLLLWKVYRDAGAGGDSMVGDADLLEVRLTIRRG